MTPGRDPRRLPLAAAIIVYTARGALGIGTGAGLVLLVYIIAKAIRHPIPDRGLGEAALSVVIVALCAWFICVLIARIADRKRGL